MPAILAFSQGMHEKPAKKACYIKNYKPEGLNLKGVNSVFNEDFSSGTFPPAGWAIVGDGAANWMENQSNEAGGEAPEAMFSWTPSFVGNSKLVTSEIATSGYTALVLEFKHHVIDYGGGYTVKVETSSDGTTWNEVWSTAVSGDIGPETQFILIDNEDIGSDNFQVAFTFDGNSFQITYWYIDDVILAESVSYDAEATSIYFPSEAAVGDDISPLAVVTNKGTETITFDANVEILQDGTASVYSENLTVTDLAPFGSEVLTFPEWNTTEGSYTVTLTTLLAGDENTDNDMVSSSTVILENGIFTQPLYEEFTSSTCGPCAGANPILDAVLGANPGTHSLVKYQMNWPGSGDPYYTEEGGVRRDYYGVYAVPDLYINSDLVYPGSVTQEIYDSYIGVTTSMEIEIVTAEIDLDYNITVAVNLDVESDYAAGLTAHIVVVEKITVGNVATNGETEFNNVMMKMLPDAAGTTLPALSVGITEVLLETYDMGLTFMEQPNDLAVVVFVQDDSDKSIIQSEMVDVVGEFEAYTVTIVVEDEEGGFIEDANVFLEGNGNMTTNESGQAIYEGVLPGTYTYDVAAAGFFPASDSLDVIDEDVSVTIAIENYDYYWFEMFDTGIPADWTIHVTPPSLLEYYIGNVVFLSIMGDDPIMLVSPLIDITPVEMLYFDIGGGYQDPILIFGTVTDPADPSTFTELETYYPVFEWETMEFDLTTLNGGESEVYLAWKLENTNNSFFGFDNVIITFADAYDVIFNVEDVFGNSVEGAEIMLEGNGIKYTDESGQAIYEGVFPGTYTYDVAAAGFFPTSGNLDLIDEDVSVTVALESTVGIENPVSENTVAIFPNPAKDMVYIKAGTDVKQVRVFNHAGQIVAQEQVNNKFYQLNVSQFYTGIYLFQVETSNGWISRKIVVD